METPARMEARAAVGEASGTWWLFLITGIAWLLLSVIVLRFNITSIAAVGALLGVVFIAAGANEFMVMALRDMGWKWLHGILAVIFIIGGVWAFIHPIDAFYELAAILGFLLIFKGTMDVIGSVIQKEISALWWLGLITGVLELLLGFWASQQYFAPRAALILVWVGFFALFHGIGEIVMAFEMRRVHKAMT
jgi:uncharacterized membrane protein HdeD (DUF308 family)